MSGASVRRSGRRDNFPVFRSAAGKRSGTRLGAEPGGFEVEVFIEEHVELVMNEKFNLEAHHGIDPGEGLILEESYMSQNATPR